MVLGPFLWKSQRGAPDRGLTSLLRPQLLSTSHKSRGWVLHSSGGYNLHGSKGSWKKLPEAQAYKVECECSIPNRLCTRCLGARVISLRALFAAHGPDLKPSCAASFPLKTNLCALPDGRGVPGPSIEPCSPSIPSQVRVTCRADGIPHCRMARRSVCGLPLVHADVPDGRGEPPPCPLCAGSKPAAMALCFRITELGELRETAEAQDRLSSSSPSETAAKSRR